APEQKGQNRRKPDPGPCFPSEPPGPRHAARVAPLHNAQRRQPSMPIFALTSWADCAPWRSYGRVRKYLSAGKPAGRTFLSRVTSTSPVPGTSRSNASGNTTASRRALLTVAFSPPLSDMAEARNTYPFTTSGTSVLPLPSRLPASLASTSRAAASSIGSQNSELLARSIDGTTTAY